MDLFADHNRQTIQDGQLDLRNWHAEDGSIVRLDGAWAFYPGQWLLGDQKQQDREQRPGQPSLLQVPGGWNDAWLEGRSTPYGFGSYRLRIEVNPQHNQNYSIRVPSVRTSSALYVNGRLLAKSGRVGTVAEEAVARNQPYSATFMADENGVIELVIQAANYVDGRSGGIVRSIKFGSEEAILKEMKLSLSMQILAMAIFLMHSIYAFILFLAGNREKRMLYFSLLTLSIALNNGLSSDDKLFHQIFYIGNAWDFRLTNALSLLALYALLECTPHRSLPFWRKVYPVFKPIMLGVAGIILFLDTAQVTALFPVLFLFGIVAGSVSLVAILNTVFRDQQGNLLLLISLLALVHHFSWSLIWRDSGYNPVYYPFDIILAVACLASVWFRNYFKMHENTNELAATLQRMNDHKDQFLANTSHEFKNPLNSILNLSEAVLKREGHLLQERSVRELETVQSVGRRLTLILNDLIDVMSLREGNPRIQKKVAYMQPIVTGVLDLLQVNAESKGVRLINQIPEDLPAVYADENRVIQIVFNLLHNAVKYTSEGTIAISAYARDGRAYVTVADTGIGMDERMLKCLFQPYEQAGMEETFVEGGFGLGLSISKQLVELHGGTIEVESVLGEGSQFMFSLALAEQEAEGGKAALQPMAPAGLVAVDASARKETDAVIERLAANYTEADRLAVGLPPVRKKGVNRPLLLVVDDDPANLQVLEAILPPDDYELTLVTSGKEALAVLDSREWDLVISDIMMPQMSGYELTRRIRERFSFTDLPILLLTARSRAEDIHIGFQSGANDYVAKPVEAIELRARIKALTTIKQAIREQLRLEAAWLQAQIQPHFIFNTLNAVMALSDIDVDKMRDLLHEFNRLLRHKFKFQNMDSLVPIEEELGLVRSYLYIEQVRFDDRLQVVWDISDEALKTDIKVPFLTLQPLVENAILHGIMKRKRGGKLLIRMDVQETQVELRIEDDGEGMDEEQLQRLLQRNQGSRSGVGLINTDQRLKRHFGTGLHIESTPGAGTRVSFYVPLLSQGD
jgi:sensor histidine kinase YesM